jgi:hypothetical protein
MGYQNCVIVGSDLFDLKAIVIETAFEKLMTDVVIACRRWRLLFMGLKKKQHIIPK